MAFEGQKILFVLLGGACGTFCRYSLSTLIYSLIRQPSFPYANLVINVSGSLLIGFLFQAFETRWLVSPAVRVALLTGVLGGYTTFSSFALETFTLLRNDQWLLAMVNVSGSLLLGLLAVWIGIRLAQILL